ncbi:hypothetical protein psal_cds_906 [Pandoravirus salinus]|uniref:DUF5900 domain-containing protein n=1 Tax=Pandoravirus salinus TaxID=1349410 RepID=A0A291ATN8_9VIRU|nr:hypothetical protein psal_cds_906 [Pandoravirus salinus]ATE82253.1 hypothetical protein psal_cds_906 [Pandoravirus salinus]
MRMRRSRRSSDGDRTALVKDRSMGDCARIHGDDSENNSNGRDNSDTTSTDTQTNKTGADRTCRLTWPASWCAAVRSRMRRRRPLSDDDVHTTGLLDKGVVHAQDGRCHGLAADSEPMPQTHVELFGQEHDGWRRVYADVYGVDAESGDPLDHAILRRIGASWRFLWECRRPIAEAPHTPGTTVQGQCLLPNGDLVRGAFFVRRLPLGPDTTASAVGLLGSATFGAGRRHACDPVLAVADSSDTSPLGPSLAGVDDDGTPMQINNTDGHRCRQQDEDNDVTADCPGGDDINSDGHNDGGDDGVVDGADHNQHPRVVCARIVCPVRRDPNSDDDDNDHNDDEAVAGAGHTFCCTDVASNPDVDKRRACNNVVLVPHGHAAAVGIDGSLVEGAFCMGLLHGHARTVDTRGEIFGRWRHGRLHGRAVATTPEGWFVCATWRDGRLVGDYFAQSSEGQQFRCATCPDGRFDGRCRRGYACGDWAIEQWTDGAFVGIERFRIAPVADVDDLAEGALLADCLWTCDRVRGGSGARYDGYIYHPTDPASPEFALFYAYMASEASERAFTPGQREAFMWAMWMAQRRAASKLPA